MAEYIEREALIAEIQKNIHTYWSEGSGGYYLAEDALNYSVKTAPTADVVPKSEVNEIIGTFEVLLYKHYNGDITEREFYRLFAELKKKYTENENGKTNSNM